VLFLFKIATRKRALFSFKNVYRYSDDLGQGCAYLVTEIKRCGVLLNCHQYDNSKTPTHIYINEEGLPQTHHIIKNTV